MARPPSRAAWAIVLTLAVAVAGCASPADDTPNASGDAEGEDTSDDGSEGGEPEPSEAYKTDQEPDRTIEIEGNLGGFNATEITVAAGEVVRVVYQNTGSQPHTWGVDVDGDANTTDDARTGMVDPGDNGTVTFEIPDPGSYAFFCDVPSHRAQGMEGTLTVE
jgi:plastocyanin